MHETLGRKKRQKEGSFRLYGDVHSIHCADVVEKTHVATERIHMQLLRHGFNDLAHQLHTMFADLHAGRVIENETIDNLIREIEQLLRNFLSTDYIEDFRRGLYGLAGYNLTVKKCFVT